MRTFAAILVLVAQFAGPWACCCAAADRTPLSRIDLPASVPAKPKPSGCRYCHTEPPAQPAPFPAAPKPPAPEPCPCGGAQLVAVPAAKSDLSDAADGLLIPLSVGLSTLLPAAVTDSPPAVGVRELPLLTAADRLFGHHVLRC